VLPLFYPEFRFPKPLKFHDMKTQSLVLTTIFLFVFGSFSFAQNAKKESIKVWGNCGMCKKTIETAASKAGASTATWDTETKMLSVSYDGKKTNAQKIQQAIAAAGYDTRDFSASDEAYNNLHSCCQYDRKNSEQNAKKESCCSNEKCSKEECKDKDCCKNGKCEHGKENCKDDKCEKGKSCCKS
jgi:hypothetical protein